MPHFKEPRALQGREDVSIPTALVALLYVEECIRCQGSGEIGVDVRCRFERAGPVPDDAKGLAIATCPSCMGMGYVETDES